jgi:hypothetical protein
MEPKLNTSVLIDTFLFSQLWFYMSNCVCSFIQVYWFFIFHLPYDFFCHDFEYEILKSADYILLFE